MIKKSFRNALLMLISALTPALRFFRLRPALRLDECAPREVVIIGGYGYGNTGDEAQLGANLKRWREANPQPQLLVLSPHPCYTARYHGCRSAPASRIIFFQANHSPGFGKSSWTFRASFWLTLARMELNARLLRAGFAPPLATSAETRLLSTLQSAAVVHVSGGGFMTGSTRSRLWDTCLVLRLCHRLGTPFFLTGQTIGLLQNWADRWLIKTSLRNAIGISLRDPKDSQEELLATGVPDHLLISGVDDALFCPTADEDLAAIALRESNAPIGHAYFSVNYHWWGMNPEMRDRSSCRLAEILDHVSDQYHWHPLFIPMVQSDQEAQCFVASIMKRKAAALTYGHKYPTVRRIIAGSQLLISFKHHPLIFALGEGIPCLAISLDPYYLRKNAGAMANVGQERFCLDDKAFFSQQFETSIGQLIENKSRAITSIQAHLPRLEKAQREFFMAMLQKSGMTASDSEST